MNPLPASFDALPPSDRLPVLFLGHGSPMNVITDNPYRRRWEALGQEMAARGIRPALILCVSAHWLTRGWHLTAMERPPTIHDFGGFPQALFDQQYPAPGAPAAAEAIGRALAPPGGAGPVGLDHSEWGLDHGAWSVLKPMFPAADIPVIQLSLDYSRPPAEHFEIGRQLRPLRERGVLIIGSGNVVHNLRAMHRSAADNQAYDWAVGFDDYVRGHVADGRLAELADFRAQGEVANLAHPTWDHYLPLLHAAGAVHEGEAPSFFNEGFQAAAISMRSMIWG